MNYSIIGGALVFPLLVACQSTAPLDTTEEAEVAEYNLERVKDSSSRLVYIDRSADIRKYTAILITPLGVDNVEITQPSFTHGTAGNRNWELTDADKQQLQKDFDASMTKKLSDNDGYDIVSAAGDHVLQISAILTRLAPNAAKDDNRSRPTGRSKVFTEGAGKMYVTVTFRDSETGDVLALAKDRKTSTRIWGINDSVRNMAEVRRGFTSWAMQIRSQLDQLRKE